jgi:hypothetical protein
MLRLNKNLAIALGILKVRRFSTSDIENQRNEVGVVVPCHNPGEILQNVMLDIDQNISQRYKMVLIMDKCTPHEIRRINSFIVKFVNQSEKLIELFVVKTRFNLFETRADNIGFSYLKESNYIFEIQADILIKEKNFDAKYIEAFKLRKDLFAVSGRGIQNYVNNYNPKLPMKIKTLVKKGLYIIKPDLDALKNEAKPKINYKTGKLFLDPVEFIKQDIFGQYDNLIECEISNFDAVNRKLFIGESIFRGPICFDNEKLKTLGYLNEESHRLGNDDHEISLKAWVKHKWRVGYLPTKIESELTWGATRKKKKLLAKISFLNMKFSVYINRRKSFLYGASSLLSELDLPPKEILEF